jgi:hypothetical protein
MRRFATVGLPCVLALLAVAAIVARDPITAENAFSHAKTI